MLVSQINKLCKEITEWKTNRKNTPERKKKLTERERNLKDHLVPATKPNYVVEVFQQVLVKKLRKETENMYQGWLAQLLQFQNKSDDKIGFQNIQLQLQNMMNNNDKPQ